MIPKIAVISDLSGFGRCSLTAAISVIAAMGVQPVPFPTAILSAQSEYESYYCDDFTDRMHFFTEEWSKMGQSFEGICTGFLTGKAQAVEVRRFLDRFYDPDTTLLVDPIMGDDGIVYDHYTKELRDIMREMVAEADVITPNLTEFSLLTGGDFNDLQDSVILDRDGFIKEAVELGEGILNKDDKQIIVTGIHFRESGNERIGNLLISKNGAKMIDFRCHEGSYSGTGDLMSSLIIGGLVRGDTAEDTLALAGRFLDRALADTVEAGTPINDGVHYEPYLSMLAKKA